MRQLVLLLAVAALTATHQARAEESSPWFQRPRWHEVVLLGAAETLILVDVLQTTDFARNRNRVSNGYAGHWEANPLLGGNPSMARVLILGGSGAALTAFTWYFLPHGVRTVFSAAVIGIEVPCILWNAQVGLSVRLPF